MAKKKRSALRVLNDELSVWQKVLGLIISGAAVLGVLYGAYVAIDSHWVLSTVYAMDAKQLGQRLDRTDLAILDGQLSDVQGKVISLEEKKALSEPERAYLRTLKDRADSLKEQISEIKQRAKAPQAK
jgi:PHD/YefM family antitoxin component YafN of YafNO toxin-antitoxin module